VNHPWTRTLGLAAILALAACRSTQGTEEKLLPFHVAVIPIQDPVVRDAAGGHDDETEMRIEPQLDQLSRGVAEALRERTFARVTLLAPFEGDAASDAVERDEAWVGQALDAGADLILQCRLQYEPVVREEKNGNFWLNMPLFLLGGPFTYFVKDHTYNAEIELSGDFYDLRTLQPSGGPPRLRDALVGLREARVLFASERFKGVDMNFLQRADGFGDYAVSLICPSGFLATESPDLQDEFADRVVDELSTEFALGVQRKRQGLVLADEINLPFYLATDDVRIQPGPDGDLTLRGDVFLSATSRATMSTWRLTAGAHTAQGTFRKEDGAPRETGERYERYRLEGRVAADPDVAYLRLDLAAEEREEFVRSYTFHIPGRAPGTAADGPEAAGAGRAAGAP
jgi:hypothetical protein